MFLLAPQCLAVTAPYVQYTHKAWRIEDGAMPGIPAAIAQTPDGYLWIGTSSGLYRFDGTQFTKFLPPADVSAKLTQILSLLADSHGTLWIGTAGNLFTLRDGKLTALAGPIGRVNQLVEDAAGQIWFARSRPVGATGGICRVLTNAIDCLGAKRCPYAGAIAIDKAGTVSAGGPSSLCQLKDGVVSTIEPEALKFTKELQGISALQVDTDGALLVGLYRNGPGLGLERLANGIFAPLNLSGVDSTSLEIASLLKDRQSGLWIGTQTTGILHAHNGRVDHITTDAGLSGTQVTTLFQDALQNVWVGTFGGLDLFRRSDVSSFGVRQGLATEEVPSVLALRDGRVLAGGAHGLSIVTKGDIRVITAKDGLPGHLVTAMYQDQAGTVWLGVDDHLVTWHDDHFAIVNSEKGEELGPIYSIVGDAGGIWATAVTRPDFKLIRIEPGKAPRTWPLPAGVSLHRLAIDSRGNMLAANLDGSLYRFDGHSMVLEASPPHGGTVDDFFFAQDSTVWSATVTGLKGWNAGRWTVLDHSAGLPCDEVESMVAVHAMLWLDLQCGYFSIPTDQVAQFGAGTLKRIKGTLFPATSGARTGVSTFFPAAVADSDQRLWFANDGPLQMIDVLSLPAAHVPPPVHIESVTVDGRSLTLARKVILPTLAKDITIAYTAIDFTDPLSVSYRYRLGDGARDWTDAGTRRTALFSNLNPGSYRFKVTAASNDGLWNEDGDSIEFIIPPIFYQTLWFRAVMGLLVGVALWGLMALRIRRAATSLELRMGERFAERDRIARELHDTLLQGVQAIVLRFQVVANAMRAGKPAESLMQSSLSKADAIIIEIRDKVQDLRVHGTRAGFLIDDIRAIQEDLTTAELPVLHCVDVGLPRSLLTPVREELNAIAREVIFNAVQHAKASRIECELRYSTLRFSLVCSDDGIGFPADVLKDGRKAGHWGLIGVRERAEKLGARVVIKSAAGQGTSVAIVLDAALAYAPGETSLLSRILCRVGLAS